MFRSDNQGRRYFFILSVLTLALMLFLSYDAPLSGDEEVHYRQAEKNLNYFNSFGKDKTALETPISRLKYYGQSFDNFTTFFIEVLDIHNVYRFRHLSNAVVTWLLILVSSLLSFKLTKSHWAAILTMLLLLISPRLIGHGLNNLKDIPFAFGYILAIYFMVRGLMAIPKIRWFDFIGMSIGIAISISIRIGGLLLICYLWLFFSLALYQYILSTKNKSTRDTALLSRYAGILTIVSLSAYLAGLIFWPYAWENPFWHPIESLQLMHNYPTKVRQIFEGKLYWSEQFPRYYAIKYMFISIPLIVLTGFGVFCVLVWRIGKETNILLLIFILITIGFPIYYSAIAGANLYGGWRQLLFVYPPFVILSGVGIYYLFTKKGKLITYLSALLFIVLLIYPVKHMIGNHPYHYIYFNELKGGYDGAYGDYEGDYYFTGYQEAYRWLMG